MKLIPIKNTITNDIGLLFYQKTGFLRYCNELGFHSICKLIEKRFSPCTMKLTKYQCDFIFGNVPENRIHLYIQKLGNASKYRICGVAYTLNAEKDFYFMSLEIIEFIAKNFGCAFFIDDAKT